MNRNIIYFGIFALVAVFAFCISACDGDSACTHGSGTWHTTLEPTCTADGSKELRCAKCGYVLETQTIDAECNCTTCNCVTCECDCANCVVVEFWTITWHLNGGTAGMGSVYPTQIEKGGTIIIPIPLPTKNNCTFAGWFTDAALTQHITSWPYTVNADLNLYVKWQQIEPMLYWGNYLPGVNTEVPGTPVAYNIDGVVGVALWGTFDIDELVEHIENARLVGVFELVGAIGAQEYKTGQPFTNQTAVTTTGLGYHYIVTPHRLSDITVLGTTSFNQFTEAQIMIDGVNYFIYHYLALSGGTFNLNLVYKQITPMFYWGNYIPAAHPTEGQPVIYNTPYGDLWGEFFIDELIMHIERARLVGENEQFQALGKQEIKSWEEAVKGNKQITYQDCFGFPYFISPAGFGNIIIRNPLNSDVTDTFNKNETTIDGIQYFVYSLKNRMSASGEALFTIQFN